MADYLIVASQTGDGSAEALSQELAGLAAANGFRVIDLNPATWLAVSGPNPPPTLAVGGWTLVGDVFNRVEPALPWTAPDDPLGFERKMVARFWGRYVGIRMSGRGAPDAVVRDPSGALDCIAWSQAGLTLIASSPPEWVLTRLRPTWRIDTDRLCRAMRDPLAAADDLLIAGPTAVQAGSVQSLPLPGTAEFIWRPADFARLRLDRDPEPAVAARSLASALDETVSRLAGIGGPIAAEISGGLDSSLVAASLRRTAPDAVALWINAHGATPESDERPFAEALAHHLGVDPTLVPHATGRMTEAGMLAISGGIRPGLNALDVAHDRDWAARFSDAGITAVMTGKGGDSILLQRATSAVFTDLWRSNGWRALLSPDMRRIAVGNEVSMWTLAGEARRHRREGTAIPRRSSALLRPDEAGEYDHPWLEGLDAFGPAKALQVAGVIDSLSHHGPSMLSRVVDVRHPLCAQPVIETCLSLSTPLLTVGGRDRGLARLSGRGRVPDLILDRRTKGSMTRVYGGMILDSLDFLRPWILDGRLVDLGVIDGAAAEKALTPDELMWKGAYGAIIMAAAMEGWVRTWEDRLARPA